MIYANAAQTLDPFAGEIAPDQSSELVGGARTPAAPLDVQYRENVEPVVGRLPGRTVSAGDEVGRIPMIFDLPSNLRRVFDRMRSGLRTTLLAPELQGELDGAGSADVMPTRGMAQPYTVRQPGPWYDSFLREIGQG